MEFTVVGKDGRLNKGLTIKCNEDCPRPHELHLEHRAGQQNHVRMGGQWGGQNKQNDHPGGWRPRSLEAYSKQSCRKPPQSALRPRKEWLRSAGRSLPCPLGKHGDDGEGQEDHTGRAPDQQAQDAAVHLHGLAALPRVEEGMTGDTPGGTGHKRSVGHT